MTDENQLSPDEVKKLRNRLDVEEIKNLRLKYSYYMDARELDDLMNVFADGAVCGYGPYGDWEGKEVIYNNYKETFKDTINTPFVSMHVNTNHIVEITGPDTAKGRVYLLDVINIYCFRCGFDKFFIAMCITINTWLYLLYFWYIIK